MRVLMLTVVLPVALAAGPVAAAPSLTDQPELREPVLAVVSASAIAKACPELRFRTFRMIGLMTRMQDRAIELGYSRAQIGALRRDKAVNAQFERIARQRLARKGAKPGDAASHCAVGRAEIAQGSAVGRLLAD